jgi:hypothetical protein
MMRTVANRYSYLITSSLMMGCAWLVGARFGGLWSAVGVAGVGIGLALLQRRLRGGSSDAAGWDDVGAGAVRDRPALLFIYSDT